MDKKKKNIIIYSVLGVVVLLAAAAVVVMLSMKPKKLTASDHINNGNSFAQSGDYEKAAAAYGLALDMEPDNIQTYIYLIDVYEKMNDTASMEGACSGAISLIEDNAAAGKELPENVTDIYYRYADLLVENGKDEEAYRLLVKDDEVISGLVSGYKSDFFKNSDSFEYIDGKAVMAAEKQMYFGGYPCSMLNPDSVPVCIKAGEFDNDIITVDGCTYLRADDGNGGYNYFRRENILWDVLSENDEGYLLISHNLVDTVQYYGEYASVDWNNSYVRKWLNEDFYEAAFSDAQKEYVQTMHVDTPVNIMYGTVSGEPTDDKVAIPSIDEMLSSEYGFDDDLRAAHEERAAAPTDYAVNNGIKVESNGNSRWWLRTNGSNTLTVAYMSEDGVIACAGSMVNDSSIGIRPMIFISKDAAESAE